LGSAKPGVRHVKSSDRSPAKKTDDGYQGQGCPCQISCVNDRNCFDVSSENSLKYSLSVIVSVISGIVNIYAN